MLKIDTPSSLSTKHKSLPHSWCQSFITLSPSLNKVNNEWSHPETLLGGWVRSMKLNQVLMLVYVHSINNNSKLSFLRRYWRLVTLTALGMPEYTSPYPVKNSGTNSKHLRCFWLHKKIVATCRDHWCFYACQKSALSPASFTKNSLSRILQFDWLRAFWPITQEPELTKYRACPKILMQQQYDFSCRLFPE